jgi:hypothetical protein
MILVALWTVTLVAHALQTPDPTDPDTLSPTATTAFGSATLAGRLHASGTPVQTVHSSADALRASAGVIATVFVPAPDLLLPDFTPTLLQRPNLRVVLVEPGDRTLSQRAFGVSLDGQRWASGTADPGCTLPAALTAGRAEVWFAHYSLAAGTPGAVCYRGGLVEARGDRADVFVVGATDPFRNDRIDEQDNSALAVDLLTGHGPVIWVDVHDHEIEPPTISPPDSRPPVDHSPLPEVTGSVDPGELEPCPFTAATTQPSPVATASPSPTPTPECFVVPGGGGSGGGGGGSGGGGQGQGGGSAQRPPSVFSVLPSLFWVIIAALAAIAVMLAAARSRRLGPPVSEPLPVLVPAAEAVTGRGRLYQRAGAYGASLMALRAAAIRRLNRALNPFGGPTDRALTLAPGQPVTPAVTAFITQVAMRSGLEPAAVETVLYGRLPRRERDLTRGVASLDRLIARTLGVPARPAAAHHPGGAP